MKKSIVSIALVLSFVSALFGFEWGGVVDNSTYIATPNFKEIVLNQSNGVHLNFSSSLTKDKSVRFNSELMYKYIFDANENKFTNIVDLSLLKLSGKWNINGALLSLNAGRFDYSDKTGFVFAQKSDGININYAARDWTLGAYAGYTGLLNRFTTAMWANENVDSKMEELYDLSYGYVPLMIDFTLNNVGGNIIGMQGEYFLDVANKNDKAFGSLFVKGPLSKVGSYYVGATVGTNKFEDLMLRASMNFQFIFGQNLMFAVGADYVSGNNEVFKTFNGISLKPIHATVVDVDAVIPRIACTYVMDNFILSVTEKLITTIPENFVVSGLDSNLSFVYNIFSDLQLCSSLNAYTDFKDKDSNNFSASVNVNFAF